MLSFIHQIELSLNDDSSLNKWLSSPFVILLKSHWLINYVGDKNHSDPFRSILSVKTSLIYICLQNQTLFCIRVCPPTLSLFFVHEMVLI